MGTRAFSVTVIRGSEKVVQGRLVLTFSYRGQSPSWTESLPATPQPEKHSGRSRVLVDHSFNRMQETGQEMEQGSVTPGPGRNQREASLGLPLIPAVSCAVNFLLCCCYCCYLFMCLFVLDLRVLGLGK